MRRTCHALIFGLAFSSPCAAQHMSDYDICSLSHEQESRHAAAIDACTRIIRDVLIPIETRADAYVFRGKYAALRGDYRSALRDLGRAVAANPQSHYAQDIRTRFRREAAGE